MEELLYSFLKTILKINCYNYIICILKLLRQCFYCYQKALRLYKHYFNESTNETEEKESLEFICECANIISETQFKNFIETMRASEFYSFNNKPIYLIKINNNYEIIYKYNFESLTKRAIEERFKLKNKSTYHTQILYERLKKNKIK